VLKRFSAVEKSEKRGGVNVPDALPKPLNRKSPIPPAVSAHSSDPPVPHPGRARPRQSREVDLPERPYLIYNSEIIMGDRYLGELEQIVLLAVVRLAEDAYGVPIRREIEKRADRKVTVGALYSTLDRLEAKGYLTSWFADPTAERGGRSRRYFRIEPRGIEALAHAKEMFDRMWKGVRLA
jgi:DNA-binding PadR family transcriptional regulator